MNSVCLQNVKNLSAMLLWFKQHQTLLVDTFPYLSVREIGLFYSKLSDLESALGPIMREIKAGHFDI